jgi:hypothetical protein
MLLIKIHLALLDVYRFKEAIAIEIAGISLNKTSFHHITVNA